MWPKPQETADIVTFTEKILFCTVFLSLVQLLNLPKFWNLGVDFNSKNLCYKWRYFKSDISFWTNYVSKAILLQLFLTYFLCFISFARIFWKILISATHFKICIDQEIQRLFFLSLKIYSPKQFYMRNKEL